jgi:WD40 repeat protein
MSTTGDQEIESELRRPRRPWPAGDFALAALILAPFLVAAATFGWWLLSPPWPEFSYPYEGRRVFDLRFSPDGSVIAACEHDDGLTVFQMADAQRLGPTQFSAPIMKCAWNPTGTLFATAARDGTSCVVWDSKTWKVKKQLRAPPPADINSLKDRYSTGLAVDQDGSVYLTTVNFGDVEKTPNYWGSPLLSQQALVWWGDGANVQGPASIGLNDEFDVSTASVGRDTLVALAYWSHSVEIFRVRYDQIGRRTIEKQFTLPRTQESRIQLSADGRFLAARNTARFLVFQLTGLSTPKSIFSRDDDLGRTMAPPMKIAGLSSDGQIAAYQVKEHVVVLHLPEGRVLLEVPSKADALAISPDGRLLAIPTGSQISFYRVPRAE